MKPAVASVPVVVPIVEESKEEEPKAKVVEKPAAGEKPKESVPLQSTKVRHPAGGAS